MVSLWITRLDVTWMGDFYGAGIEMGRCSRVRVGMLRLRSDDRFAIAPAPLSMTFAVELVFDGKEGRGRFRDFPDFPQRPPGADLQFT